MAQRHLDPTAGPVPADALAGYLRARATEFLCALRLHRETGAGAAASEDSVEAARALRRAARRISASLHTFQPVLDRDWSESMRPELAWVSGTLAQEHAYATRLDQLLLTLHRLSGPPQPPQPAPTRAAGAIPPPQPAGSRAAGAIPPPQPAGSRAAGAARVGAGST
ncbi:CHAD domain-containing protein, partial [Streptomyces edwardsiae]